MFIYIRSMSEAQSRIYDKLAEHSWGIDEHLIKLLLLPNCKEAEHWKREIVKFVDRVDKLKGKNRYPSAKFIKKCLSVHNDMTSDLLRKVRSELKEPNKRPVTSDEVSCVLEQYQDWLASELSAHGLIDYDSAYEVIDEIISKAIS